MLALTVKTHHLHIRSNLLWSKKWRGCDWTCQMETLEPQGKPIWLKPLEWYKLHPKREIVLSFLSLFSLFWCQSKGLATAVKSARPHWSTFSDHSFAERNILVCWPVNLNKMSQFFASKTNPHIGRMVAVGARSRFRKRSSWGNWILTSWESSTWSST